MMGDYRVVGPVAKGSKFAFGEIEDPADLRLDYNTSILPPKKYLQPQEERMMTFTRSGQAGGGNGHRRSADRDPGRPHLRSARACACWTRPSARAIPMPTILRRREQTLLVGIECLEPCDEHSFCKSMGTLTVSNGYDLHLTDLGEAYAVDVGTEAGRGSAEQVRQRPPGQQRPTCKQLNKVLGAKWPRFPYKLEFDVGELSSLMSQSYDSPVWDQLAEICLACGQCTLVCPTCFCFNVYDEVELNLQDGERRRRWDSCQLDEFARRGRRRELSRAPGCPPAPPLHAQGPLSHGKVRRAGLRGLRPLCPLLPGRHLPRQTSLTICTGPGCKEVRG